jgi:hypothetical protein
VSSRGLALMAPRKAATLHVLVACGRIEGKGVAKSAMLLVPPREPDQPFAVRARWLTGRLATKVKCADSVDVRSARILHPTRTEGLAFTGHLSQLLRPQSPDTPPPKSLEA